MSSQHRSALLPTLLLPLLLLGCTGDPPPLTLAVASNFSPTAEALAASFTAQSGKPVRIQTGSTGKLHAQIKAGAPIDLFLAADSERPRLLEADGTAVAGSRRCYARGRLLLWTAETGIDIQTSLLNGHITRLAIAKPELAPYGRAAEEVLAAMQLDTAMADRLVYGENIAQAAHFVRSGNAQAGLLARAQLAQLGEGSHWLVPAELHAPIDQELVLIRDSADARAFLAFLTTDEARAIISAAGYQTP